MVAASMPLKKRLYYLDNLKVFLTMLVIVHHVGQAYGPTGGFWQYRSSLHESIPWLGSFFSVNAAFFMGLFFLISGYFIPGSYDRKGGKGFLKEKLVRFGIPVLFALFVMVPLEMFFYYSHYSGNRPASFWFYYTRIYFPFGHQPSWFRDSIGWPEFNFGHLWFVENLLVYSGVYALIRSLGLRWQPAFSDQPRFRTVLTIAATIAVCVSVVRIWYPIDKWVGVLFFIQSEVAHLPQYVILFTVGIVAYRKDWLNRCSTSTGYASLVLGTVMALAQYLRLHFPEMGSIIYDYWAVYESFMAVFLCWGLIVLFREKLNYASATSRLFAESSYAAYIFHYPIVLATQYSLDGVHILGAWGKFVTVSLISVSATYLMSVVVRRLALARRVI